MTRSHSPRPVLFPRACVEGIRVVLRGILRARATGRNFDHGETRDAEGFAGTRDSRPVRVEDRVDRRINAEGLRAGEASASGSGRGSSFGRYRAISLLSCHE